MAFDVLTMGRIGVDISPLQIAVSLREDAQFRSSCRWTSATPTPARGGDFSRRSI